MTLARHADSRSTRLWLGMTIESLATTLFLPQPYDSVKPFAGNASPFKSEITGEIDQAPKQVRFLLLSPAIGYCLANPGLDSDDARQEASLPGRPMLGA